MEITVSKHSCAWFVITVILIASVSVRADGPSFLESYADPSNAKNILAVFDSASPNGIYLLQSLDGGFTWAKLPAPDGTAARKGGRQDVSDFFVRIGKAPVKRVTIVYANLELFRAGPDLHWEKLASTPGQVQQIIPTDDPQRFFLVASARQGSALYFTDSGGQSWTNRTEALPFRCNLSNCELVASSDGGVILYRTFRGDGYASKDGGRTWQSESSDNVTAAISSLGFSRGSVIKGTPNQVRAAVEAVKKPISPLPGSPIPERIY